MGASNAGAPDAESTEVEPEISRLRRRDGKLRALLDVAQALTREHQIDALLDLILAQSIKTVDAERGSLFIVDAARRELWSKIAQGHEHVIRFPIGVGIAGFVAKTAAPLNIDDAYADDRFNREFDLATGFQTRSILCVPMLGSRHEVVGVIQALNHRDGPFSPEDEELLMAFGANAAAALENANLYKEIEGLFEGFVQASVTAIESRDPTTAGHSGRVAALSITAMQSLASSVGPYHGVQFTEPELREMRYAALLHDFGKVGVREHVLLKANKLYPHELDMLESRFEHARRALEVTMLRAKVDILEREPQATGRLHALETAYAADRLHLDEMLALIRRCNLPTVLEQGGFERLSEIAARHFVDSESRTRALLEPTELANLSIPRGSLNEVERREIESHVTHTFNFLKRIPWTRDLARIPDFAHGHHEKLNGGGYPLGVAASSIPIQTRIMSIADIYDALTAADRPYKKAVPHDKAVDILAMEANRGFIDRELLTVFLDAEVPARALPRRPD